MANTILSLMITISVWLRVCHGNADLVLSSVETVCKKADPRAFARHFF